MLYSKFYLFDEDAELKNKVTSKSSLSRKNNMDQLFFACPFAAGALTSTRSSFLARPLYFCKWPAEIIRTKRQRHSLQPFTAVLESGHKLTKPLPAPHGFVDQQVFTRLAVAIIAGALIGLERRAASATARVRTLVLVALASAIFTLVALPTGSGDPIRIAASIAAGVGFIGSGVISSSSDADVHSRGLTTAASIWISASLGVTAAFGLISTTLMGALMTVGILRLSIWERFLRRKWWKWERMKEIALRRKKLLKRRDIEKK